MRYPSVTALAIEEQRRNMDHVLSERAPRVDVLRPLPRASAQLPKVRVRLKSFTAEEKTAMALAVALLAALVPGRR